MNTTTQQPASNDLRCKINTNDTEGNDMTITIRLNDECKNGHQDFAITADVYKKGKPKTDRYFVMGGCCHDEILAVRPDLKIFVDLHLCDYKGIPMHAVENGFYHLREGFNDTKPDSHKFKIEFCDYYRIKPDQFDVLNTSENKLQYALFLQNLGILKQWELQANEAIRQLEKMTGKKFIVDSKRTQYNAPTPEQIEEEKQKQASGYYTPEAKEQRENEEILKIEAGIDAEWEAKEKEIAIEYSLKKRVLHVGGKKALDNCIYYNHTKTLAFNWKGYDRISDELFNKIKSEIILPEGVTIKNDNK